MSEQYSLSQFEQLKSLGTGSYGVVQQVRHRDTGDIFAMKVLEKKIIKDRGMQEQLHREVATQMKVSSPYVVRMHSYFEDSSKVYCLLEYADGGQLFAYLQEPGRGPLPEHRAAQLFSDTAQGVAYLHGLDVVHRDLKPENILLFGPHRRAKVADLGWCVPLTAERPDRQTFCGTLDYIAPEMLLGEPHDFAVDLWALGVLLFEMLLARAPFQAKSQNAKVELICACKVELPPGSMSEGAAELIQGLLRRDKKSRTPLATVLQHRWVVTLAGSVAAAGAASGMRVPSPDLDALDGTKIVKRVERIPPDVDAMDETVAMQRQRPKRDASAAVDCMLTEQTALMSRQRPREDDASGKHDVAVERVQPDADAMDETVAMQRRRPKRDASAAVDCMLTEQTALMSRQQPRGDDASGKHDVQQLPPRERAHEKPDCMLMEQTAVMQRRRQRDVDAGDADAPDMDATVIAHRRRSAPEADSTVLMQRRQAALEMDGTVIMQRRRSAEEPSRGDASELQANLDATVMAPRGRKERPAPEFSSTQESARPAKRVEPIPECPTDADQDGGLERTVLAPRAKRVEAILESRGDEHDVLEETVLAPRRRLEQAAAPEGEAPLRRKGVEPIRDAPAGTLGTREVLDRTEVVQRRGPMGSGREGLQVLRPESSGPTTGAESAQDWSGVAVDPVYTQDLAAGPVAELNARMNERLNQMDESIRGKVDMQNGRRRLKLEGIQDFHRVHEGRDPAMFDAPRPPRSWSSSDDDEQFVDAPPQSLPSRAPRRQSTQDEWKESDLLTCVEDSRVPLEDLDRDFRQDHAARPVAQAVRSSWEPRDGLDAFKQAERQKRHPKFQPEVVQYPRPKPERPGAQFPPRPQRKPGPDRSCVPGWGGAAAGPGQDKTLWEHLGAYLWG